MMGAIDAVCVAAARIIERLTSASEVIAAPLPDVVASQQNGERPPTPAMKRFVDSIAKQKGIKPPRGYTKSGSMCRGFLDQHAAKNRDSGASGEIAAARPASAPIHRDPKMAREPVAAEPDSRCRSQLQILPARFRRHGPPNATSQHSQRESDFRRPQDLPDTTTCCAYGAKPTATNPWNRDAAAHPLWQ